jgi:hypothetical protein
VAASRAQVDFCAGAKQHLENLTASSDDSGMQRSPFVDSEEANVGAMLKQ